MNREGNEIVRAPGIPQEAGRRTVAPRPARGWGDLVDDLNAVVWEAIPATLRLTYVNAAAERVLGYPPHQWLDEPDFWVGIVHPEDRMSVDASQARARGGTTATTIAGSSTGTATPSGSGTRYAS
ncbi:MAG: hypothetical protein EXR92_01350 [Gemmatimonadetes bacterium]|nr:hypothetical protein [Gemmatimonadota bacterium]